MEVGGDDNNLAVSTSESFTDQWRAEGWLLELQNTTSLQHVEVWIFCVGKMVMGDDQLSTHALDVLRPDHLLLTVLGQTVVSNFDVEQHAILRPHPQNAMNIPLKYEWLKDMVQKYGSYDFILYKKCITSGLKVSKNQTVCLNHFQLFSPQSWYLIGRIRGSAR